MQNTLSKSIALLSILISTIGLVVLVGWQFDIEFLKRPIPNLAAMNPVTAVGFLLTGGALFATLKNKTSENKFKWVTIFTSVTIFLIGLLKLSDVIFSTEINEEEWLFSYIIFNEKLRNVTSRIAPLTALNFILLGISIILSNTFKSINKSIANYFALAVFLTGLFSTLGYAYNVPEFSGILSTNPMAVHTAICFLLASASILLINNDKGFVHDFSGSRAAIFASKILIPVIVLFPFSLGIINLYILHNYTLSVEFLVAAAVAVITIIFFIIVWYIARQLNKISAIHDKSEKELSLSHERFFKFFKASPVATIIVNIKTNRYVHVNYAFLKLFSFTRDQVIGKSSTELNMIDPATREKLLAVVREKGFNYENLEVKLRDAKGNLMEVLTSTQQIEIKGEPHMLSTMVNISEMKKFEEEIIKSRKSLNDAQKLSKTGSWEFNLKTGDLYWSDELYHIFEVAETPSEKLFEVCRKKIHPDDIANLDNAINLANETGVAAVYEHRIIMGDGSIKYLLGLGEIINDEEGKPQWLRGTTQDITERKVFENSLEKITASLEIAQKIGRLGSWEWDIISGQEKWSDEQYRIFGYQPREIEASYTLFVSHLHSDDKTNVLMAVELALKGIYKFETEYRIITKQGEIKHLEARGEVEKDKNGNAIFMRGTVLDITERKLTNQKLNDFYNQLEIKNKELEQFAFIASHDLQEPLRTINSFTELLTEEYAEKFDTNANTYIRFISQSAIRMRDLITRLLEYSRLGNNISSEQTDCNIIVKRVMENLHASIKESGAIIKAENLPVLNAYPIELELLFQNLIGNAIKFRKKTVAPEIIIKAEKIERAWQFSLTDNGIGIDAKHFEKIFLLFQRLHSRDNFEGSGIGLSQCKKIAELHNGKIWVESKTGEGSIFYFTIAD